MKSYRLILISVVACVVVGAIRVYAGTLTLTTYYPAPTGNYQKMTVTGDGTGVARIGTSGCGGNYVGIGLNGAMTNCSQYSLLGGDGNLFLNRPSGGNMYFRMNNNDQMFISSAGSVGIGVTTPNSKLQVGGNLWADGIITSNSEPAYGAGSQLRSWGVNKDDSNMYIEWGNAASNTLYITDHWRYTSPVAIMAGSVGIGNANPQYLLDMAGGGFYDSSKGKWQNGSSIKFKQDITRGKIDPFKILEQVDIINYRYKAEVKNNPNAPYHIGFIAENTPELLSGPKRNIMDIGDSIGLLLAVVKQQQKEIENLQQEVSRLKAKIKSP